MIHKLLAELEAELERKADDRLAREAARGRTARRLLVIGAMVFLAGVAIGAVVVSIANG